MAIAILNQEGFKELSKYSGNPFLDAMVDLQDVFNTLSAYQQHKPYIDKYSDTSLSDLKDKIKANLPEALDDKGNIDFNKLQELANQGNKMAEAVLGVKQLRENFANASIGEKLKTFLDKEKQPMLDIISGNILTKQAEVLKKLQKFDEGLKKLPEPIRTFLSYNKEAFLDKPELLFAIMSMYGDKLVENTQTQTQEQAQNQTNSNATQEQAKNFLNLNAEDIIFSPPAIQSMQSIFEEKTNNILQSIFSGTKKSKQHKKKSEKQSNKQPTNNKLTIETLINSPFKPLNLTNTNQTTENSNNLPILNLFKKTFLSSSSQPSDWLFNPINALIKRNQ